MQISHYLIKYALICMHFQNRNLIIGQSQVQNCFNKISLFFILLTFLIQKLDGNKLQKYKCYWRGDFWLSAGEKSHFKKITFKICIATEIYRHK